MRLEPDHILNEPLALSVNLKTHYINESDKHFKKTSCFLIQGMNPEASNKLKKFFKKFILINICIIHILIIYNIYVSYLKTEQECFVWDLKHEAIAECFRPDKSRIASFLNVL